MTQNDTLPGNDRSQLPITRKNIIWSWITYGLIVVSFFAAFISNAVGNVALMTLFSVVCTVTLTFTAVLYLIRKALHDAPQSQAVANGNSVTAVVFWKTLWLGPVLLLFIGMVRCIAGVTPDGILIGVIGTLVGMFVMPIYAILGIARVTKKR